MAYVYLIAEQPEHPSQASEWTKIGYSGNDPNWRMNHNLKMGNPRNIAVMAVYEFEDKQTAQTAEAHAHKEFAEYAHQKEWFRMNWKNIDEQLRRLGFKPTTQPFKMGS